MRVTVKNIMNPSEKPTRATVIGIDGSGKSTAAHAAARLLSIEHPESDIRVADSTGLAYYGAGEITRKRFEGLDKIEPAGKSSKLETVVRMGSFTLLRQFMESEYAHSPNSLTIGVRDPFRIDLAAYLPIFLGDKVSPSPERRLKLFSKFTRAIHPSTIAFLNIDPQVAHANTTDREVANTHETPEKIQRAADDFPHILDTYRELYGVPFNSIEALTPTTADEVAAQFDPFVPSKR